MPHNDAGRARQCTIVIVMVNIIIVTSAGVQSMRTLE